MSRLSAPLLQLCHLGQICFERVLFPSTQEIATKQGTITLAGTVQKLIDRSLSKESPHAQLTFAGAEYLYDSLRIPNTHGWKEGRAIEMTTPLF